MKVVALRPSAWRTSAALLFMIASSMVAVGFTATGDQFWPRMSALVGLVALALVIVWFIFVPVELEFDRVEITIRYRFRRSRTIPWLSLSITDRVGVCSSCSSQAGPSSFFPRRSHLPTGMSLPGSSTIAIQSARRMDGLAGVDSGGRANRPNRAIEPTPPDLIMSLFAVHPAVCSGAAPTAA
jgi:hypothetical protein